MRRKIEKFLAKQQGVEEGDLKHLKDGRFDFMGDVESVLSAVRGKDGVGRPRHNSVKKKKVDSKKRSTKKKTKAKTNNNNQSSNKMSGTKQSTSNQNEENMGANQIQKGLKRPAPGESGLGDLYRFLPTGGLTPQRNQDCTKIMDNIGLFSPEFNMNSPKFSNIGLHKPSSKSTPKELGDIFSPGMTPLPVSRDNFMETSLSNADLNIFSPEIDVSRSLFSCPNEKPKEVPTIALKVAVSPILQSPKKIPFSKRRKFFTDESLVQSFDGSKAQPISSSQSSSICLGMVLLQTSKAVITPEDKDPLALSFDPCGFEKGVTKNSNTPQCRPSPNVHELSLVEAISGRSTVKVEEGLAQ
jgi:hypothetical protein